MDQLQARRIGKNSTSATNHPRAEGSTSTSTETDETHTDIWDYLQERVNLEKKHVGFRLARSELTEHPLACRGRLFRGIDMVDPVWGKKSFSSPRAKTIISLDRFRSNTTKRRENSVEEEMLQVEYHQHQKARLLIMITILVTATPRGGAPDRTGDTRNPNDTSVESTA